MGVVVGAIIAIVSLLMSFVWTATGAVRLQGGITISRSDNPYAYWVIIAVFGIIGLLAASLAVFAANFQTDAAPTP